MLRPLPTKRVMVHVAEIPRCTPLDQTAAPRTQDTTTSDLPRPTRPQRLVPRPILLHHHAFPISWKVYATTGLAPNNQRTILKSGGDFSIGAVSEAARKKNSPPRSSDPSETADSPLPESNACLPYGEGRAVPIEECARRVGERLCRVYVLAALAVPRSRAEYPLMLEGRPPGEDRGGRLPGEGGGGVT